LFIWARENSDTSYRQGMHELLGPIILVLYRDARPLENDDPLSHLVNSKYIEHDAYQLFERLMRKMKDYFLVVRIRQLPKKHPLKDDEEEDPSIVSNNI
jgi:hypothetical protein